MFGMMGVVMPVGESMSMFMKMGKCSVFRDRMVMKTIMVVNMGILIMLLIVSILVLVFMAMGMLMVLVLVFMAMGVLMILVLIIMFFV